MATIVFFLALWGFCKALKAIRRVWANRPAYEPEQDETERDNPVARNLATLDALQKQRDQIRDTISYLKETITTAETPEKTIQYMDRLSSLYGKLAIVENKISKLISR